jgi:branched chain amino acid efflux pump
MSLLAIAVLAAGTYAFRLTGPAFRHRLSIPGRMQQLLSVAAAVLLTALVATAALTQGHSFAGWARPAGILVGGALAIRGRGDHRRAPVVWRSVTVPMAVRGN